MWRVECADGEVHSVKIYDDEGKRVEQIHSLTLEMDCNQKYVQGVLTQLGGLVVAPLSNVRLDVHTTLENLTRKQVSFNAKGVLDSDGE